MDHLDRAAQLMRDIDICVLTKLKVGALAGRPMSNNGEVNYDGDSYFFTRDTAGMVADIAVDPTVALAFHKIPGMLAGAPIFVHVAGRAELVRDKAAFAAYWHKSLDMWFEDGIDTPDLIMMQSACAAHCVLGWGGEW